MRAAGRVGYALRSTMRLAIIRTWAIFAGAGCSWQSSWCTTVRSKAPFDPALKLHAKIKKAAMDAGLLCYPMGGTIDGVRGDHVLLAPPFIISDDETRILVERLVEAVDTALRAIGT